MSWVPSSEDGDLECVGVGVGEGQGVGGWDGGV